MAMDIRENGDLITIGDEETVEYTKVGEDFPYLIKDNKTQWIATVPYALALRQGLGSNTDDIQDICDGGTLLDKLQMFYFPINPESMNITTPFAVTITPTAGGIVEENSGVVFYNIQLRGTTGVTPNINFKTGQVITPQTLTKPSNDDTGGRPVVQSNLISKNGSGFGANTVNAINSAASTIVGVDNPIVKSSISLSGYNAFHSLYRLICRYNQAKSQGSKAILFFVNYKDGNQYQVAIKNFTLIRDKSRPHLYQYSIDMQGWSIQSADDKAPAAATQEERLKQLGLTNGTSLKAELANAIEGVKSVIRAAANTLNTVAGDLRI